MARMWLSLREHTLLAAMFQPAVHGTGPVVRDEQRVQVVWNVLIVEAAVMCALAGGGAAEVSIPVNGDTALWIAASAGCGFAAMLACMLAFQLGNAPRCHLGLPFKAKGEDRGEPAIRARVCFAWAGNALLYVSSCLACAWYAAPWASIRVRAVLLAAAVALVATWIVLEPARLIVVAALGM